MSGDSYGYDLSHVTDALEFGIRSGSNGDATIYASSTGVSDDEWHHIVGMWNGLHLKLFVDGIEVGTPTAWTYAQEYNGGEFKIGKRSTGLNFVGSIDEVGVWNRALTSAEVIELYNSGAGITHPF